MSETRLIKFDSVSVDTGKNMIKVNSNDIIMPKEFKLTLHKK